MALESEADELYYGGGAGGGKSDLLLGYGLSRSRSGIVFRRQFKQLEGPEGLIERSKKIVGKSDQFNNSRMIWRIGDRQLEFGAVDHEDDKEKYQGRAHDFKGFDEITQFTESQYVYLTAWARTTTPGQRVRTIACGNPPQNAEGEWVIQRWAPWLDEQHPNPAKPGELRWFARIDGKDTEVDGPEPFDHNGEMLTPSSRTFIPARVTDNPFLLATDYVRRLQSMPEPLRSQLLFGDHSIGLADDEWQTIPTAWVRAAQARWTPERPEDVPLMQMGVDVAQGGDDNTVIARRYGTWFAEPEVHPGISVPDAQHNANHVEQALMRGGVAAIDSDGIGASTYFLLAPTYPNNVVAYRGSARTMMRDRSGVLTFVNCLTGGARVSPIGQLKRIYRSRYDGTLYRIKTARGDQFTATANHHVLTLDGWQTVQSLNVGDQLCDAMMGDRTSLRSPEVNGMPPTIREVYRAARERFGSEWIVGSGVNFHGDRPAGEVEVVSINGELDMLDPILGQHRRDADLIGLLHGSRDAASPGRLDQPFRIGHLQMGSLNHRTPNASVTLSAGVDLGLTSAVRAQAIGFVHTTDRDAALSKYASDLAFGPTERSGQFLDRTTSDVRGTDGFRVTDRLHRQAVSDIPPSWLNTVFFQDTANDVPINEKVLAERMHGTASQIPADEVVSINIISPLEHDAPFVYTLETSTGAYTTGSIVHQNCRAAAWWAFRDALDPAHGSQVALPPSRELRAELCAVRYEKQTNGIKLEDKKDTKKRIGRSPDLADAYVMANAYWLVGRPTMQTHDLTMGSAANERRNDSFQRMRLPAPARVR